MIGDASESFGDLSRADVLVVQNTLPADNREVDQTPW